MRERKDALRTGSARRRLGRGLDSLISAPVRIGRRTPAEPETPEPGSDHAPAEIRSVAVEAIRPNPDQPRQRFDEEALEALATSIRSAGVMQPIVLRPDPGGGFQLVVGERRWRAARRIGLTHLPALVRGMDDRTVAEWGLIENLQREDLNPIERAEAFHRLTQDHGLTHQEVADRVGLKRSSVTNLLRLLELDELAKDAVRDGRLSVGHAKALLAITNLQARQRLASLAIRHRWPVRTLERQASALARAPQREASDSGRHRRRPPHLDALERQLADQLGTKVSIRPGAAKGSGRLIIEFYNLEQFDGLMQRMGLAATLA